MFIERYTGRKVLHNGYNPALTTTDENLADHSALISYTSTLLSAAAKVQVSCANVADTAAGTGARVLRIVGLDADYKIQTEDIELNGQAYVESVKSYIRVFAAEVVSAGSGGTNAGIIYIIVSGTGGTLAAGVPPTLTSQWIQVLVGFSTGTSGIYTVPAGYSAMLKRVTGACMAQPGILSIYACKPSEGVIKRELIFGIGTNQNMNIDIEPGVGCDYPEKTDIYLRGLSTTAAGRMSAQLALELL